MTRRHANGPPEGEKLVTRRLLAARLGCNPGSISRWVEEGCPRVERGHGRHPALYDEAQVRAWLSRRDQQGRQPATALLAARTRRELAAAAESEQRMAVRAGELIGVEVVERIWGGQVAAIRAKLLAMPIALADKLHRVGAVEGATGIERVLQTAIYDTLSELASGATIPKRRKRPVPKATTPKTRRTRSC